MAFTKKYSDYIILLLIVAVLILLLIIITDVHLSNIQKDIQKHGHSLY